MADGRTVLGNCCEDWILEWGEYYKWYEKFKCLPHGHVWQRIEKGFLEIRTNLIYQMHTEPGGFQYLVPVAADRPLLERCCSLILTRWGPAIPKVPFEFLCPRCKTPWHIERRPSLPATYLYRNTGNGLVYIMASEATPPFLLEPVFSGT